MCKFDWHFSKKCPTWRRLAVTSSKISGKWSKYRCVQGGINLLWALNNEQSAWPGLDGQKCELAKTIIYLLFINGPIWLIIPFIITYSDYLYQRQWSSWNGKTQKFNQPSLCYLKSIAIPLSGLLDEAITCDLYLYEVSSAQFTPNSLWEENIDDSLSSSRQTKQHFVGHKVPMATFEAPRPLTARIWPACQGQINSQTSSPLRA